MTKTLLAKKLYSMYREHSKDKEELVLWDDLHPSERDFMESISTFVIPAFKRHKNKIRHLAQALKRYYEPEASGCTRCAVIDKLESLAGEFDVE